MEHVTCVCLCVRNFFRLVLELFFPSFFLFLFELEISSHFLPGNVLYSGWLVSKRFWYRFIIAS